MSILCFSPYGNLSYKGGFLALGFHNNLLLLVELDFLLALPWDNQRNFILYLTHIP